MGNRETVEAVLAAMGEGDLQPLFDAMAEDVTWSWMGADTWSKTFTGKHEVVDGLFGSVAETVSPGFTTVVHRVLVDGDHVVVEHSGRNTTPDGRRYDNRYCWVLRLEDGLLREVREYMDTLLVDRTFGDDGTTSAPRAEP